MVASLSDPLPCPSHPAPGACFLMLSAGVQITSVCPQRATEHPHTTPALFVVRPQADRPRYYIPRRFKRRTA